jgi:hypothetical protein
MKFALSALTALLGFAAPALAHAEPHGPQAAAPSGVHGFDFEVGHWRVHHKILKNGKWIEFDGTCTDRKAVDGSVNIEEHTFDRPSGVTYGVAVRAYDAKDGTWAIWWIDSRQPHAPMDPPVVGRFEDGVGRFYSDSTVDGHTTRTRYTWSAITPTSARWDQATSDDDGQTWATNWIMDFERVP